MLYGLGGKFGEKMLSASTSFFLRENIDFILKDPDVINLTISNPGGRYFDSTSLYGGPSEGHWITDYCLITVKYRTAPFPMGG